MKINRIYSLLLIGGVIVAAHFMIVRLLGVGTWEAWWVSNFFHVLGGAYGFWLTRAFYLVSWSRHKTQTTPWMEILIFIFGALVLGVIWEWLELVIDRYQVLVLGRRSIMTYADNIGDLALDILGAILAGLVYKFRINAK